MNALVEEKCIHFWNTFTFVLDGTGYEGYCVDLINELKQLMDFEYEIYEAPENAYGRMNADGEWNGMVR